MELAPIAPDIRAQALGLIVRRLGGEPDLSTPLADFGDLAVVNVLIDLEQAFAIPLDVDDVLPTCGQPGLTVAGLLILVQRRTMIGPRFTPLPSNCFAAFKDARQDAAAERCRVLAQARAMEREALDATAEGWPSPPPADPPPIQSARAPTLTPTRARPARRGGGRPPQHPIVQLFQLAALAGAVAGLVFYFTASPETAADASPWSFLP